MTLHSKIMADYGIPSLRTEVNKNRSISFFIIANLLFKGLSNMANTALGFNDPGRGKKMSSIKRWFQIMYNMKDKEIQDFFSTHNIYEANCNGQ